MARYLPILFLTVLAASTARSPAAVIVDQIEAFESGNYAPVDVSASVVTSTAFPGIAFIAIGGIGTTASAHAAEVGREIYGAGSPAQSAISTVYVDSASDFIESQLLADRPAGAGPAPQTFPAGVSVANLSFVAPLGTRAKDLDAARRLDTIAAKGNVTVVAGAVAQTSGSFANTDLFWSARNAIAVRGSSSSTPFTPAGGHLGRTHADVWSDDTSSSATGRVSGYAAALINRARAIHQPAAARDYTIRGLLMTGADRTATGGTVTPFTSDTPNHFDADSGAGKADYTASLGILNAGPVATTAVIGNAPKSAKATTRTQGYTVPTLAKKSLTAILFQSASPISNLTATLTWDVVSTLKGSRIDTSDKATPFADLALDVRRVTKTAKGAQLSAPLKTLGLVSDARNDNVEHLAFTGSLPAGTYAFVLRGDNSLTTPAAFSYLFDNSVAPALQAAPPSISIPEPAPVAAIFAMIALAGMRRVSNRSRTMKSVL